MVGLFSRVKVKPRCGASEAAQAAADPGDVGGHRGIVIGAAEFLQDLRVFLGPDPLLLLGRKEEQVTIASRRIDAACAAIPRTRSGSRHSAKTPSWEINERARSLLIAYPASVLCSQRAGSRKSV